MLRTLLIAAATFGIAASAQAADLAGPYVGGAVTHDSFGGSGDLEGLGLNGVGGSVFAGYNVPLASGFVGERATSTSTPPTPRASRRSGATASAAAPVST